MTLREYAEKLGIQYRTAWNHFKDGKIKGAYKHPTGTIIVPDEETFKPVYALYCRVGSSQNKNSLDTQEEKVSSWAVKNGYSVTYSVKEVGSGLDDNRKKLLKLLDNPNVTHIIVEHKNRLTRFGFNYINSLLKARGGEVIVINCVDTDKEDLMQDFVSVITSFCARIYGRRRTKRNTEKLLEEINN